MVQPNRDKMTYFKFVVLVLSAILGSALSVPLTNRDPTQCAGYCKTTEKFQYEPGKTYIFDYDTNVVSQMHAEASEDVQLHMRATAEFTVLTPCEISLKLENVHLEETDKTGSSEAEDLPEFSKALQQYPMRFAFQDGVIESLCPMKNEEPWVLNVKRGIISLFQNSMADFEGNHIITETDIMGTCETHYEISNGIYSTSITKTKDLSTCKNRQMTYGGTESMSFLGGSGLHKLPVLKSKHQCTQNLKHSRLQKSECQEEHVFAPFDSNLEGSQYAITKGTHSLTFNSETDASNTGFDIIEGKESLLFQHDHSIQHDGEIAIAQEMIKKLEAETENAVSAESPKLFSSIVAHLKTLDETSLKEVYDAIEMNQRERKIFVDAVLLVGNAPSIALMNNLIKEGKLSSAESTSWFTSIAFISHPNEDMIAASIPTLKQNPPQQALLGISAMVHRYCEHNTDCLRNKHIQELLNILENYLGTACRPTDSEHHRFLLAVLKAIGNIGLPFSQDSKTLMNCFTEANIMELRISALQALRRQPCQPSLEEQLLNIFKDHNQDSELRINAYLALMRCPSVQILDQVQESLASEPVNQVGSFVWTHLTNLQETSDPTKREVKELLASDFLKNKFNTDARKFSRNFEGTYKLKNEDIGIQAESNVIFSTKSFIPRSANLNLTTHIFGEAINLLEIGGRVEGLEDILEALFGKNGYWPTEEVSTVFENLRSKREIDQDELSKYLYHTPEELHGHAYARIFGNDIILAAFRNRNELKDQFDAFHPKSLFDRLLNGNDIDITKNIHFMNSEFTLPLSSGFPLHLAVNGTSSLRLRAHGNFDSSKLHNGKLSASGFIKPSAAIEINGIMNVGAGNQKRTGIHLQGIIASSSMIGGHINIDGGKIISASLDVPWNKLELLEMKTELSLVKSGHRRITQAKKEATPIKSCIDSSVSNVLGITACSQIQLPSLSPSAFNGNSQLRIILEKTDNFKSFNFDYSHDVQMTERGPIASGNIKFDTPGSNTDRQISLSAIMDIPSHIFKINAYSPLKQLDVIGKYSCEDTSKSIDFSINVDKEKLLTFSGQVLINQEGEETTYEPSLSISTTSSKLSPIVFNGRLDISPKKFNAKMNVEGISAKPIILKGSGVMKKNQKIKVEGLIDGPNLNANFHSSIKLDENISSFSLGSKYSINNQAHETFNMQGKYSKEVNGGLVNRNLVSTIESSAKPYWNGQFQWNMQQSPGHLENSFIMKGNQIDMKIVQFWSAQLLKGLDLNTYIIAESQSYQIDSKLGLQAKFEDDKFSLETLLRLSQKWEGKLNTAFSRIGNPLKLSWEGSIEVPNKSLKVQADIFSSNSGTYTMELSSFWNSERVLTAIVSYNDASTELTLDHRLNIVMRKNSEHPVALNGKFKAEGQISSLMTEIEYDGSSHALVVEVSSQTQFNHHIKYDLKGPAYQYSGYGDFEILPHKFEANLVMEHGQKWSAQMQMLNTEEKSIKFNFVPENESHKIDIAFQILPLEYSFKILSPTIESNGHLKIGQEKITAAVAWNSNKEISLEAKYRLSGISQGKLDISLKTPFASMEYYNFNIEYLLKRSTVDIGISMEQNTEKLIGIGIYGNGEDKEGEVHLEGKLNSEGKLLEYWGANAEGAFKLHFGPEDIELNFSGICFHKNFIFQMKGHMNAHEQSGKVYVQSEFFALQEIGFQVNCKQDDSTTFSNLTITLDKDIWSIGLTTNHDLASGHSGLEAKLKTPLAEYEDINVSLNIFRKGQEIEILGKFKAPRKLYNIRFSGIYSSEGFQNNMKAQGMVSGSDIPEIQLDFSHELQNEKNEFITKLETQGLFFHPIKIEINGRSKVGDILGKLQFNVLGQLGEGKFRIKKEGDQYHGGFMASFGADRIEAEINSLFRSVSSFELKGMISTPWKYIPQTYFEASHECSNGAHSQFKLEQTDLSISFIHQFIFSENGWRNFIDFKSSSQLIQALTIINENSKMKDGWNHKFEFSHDGKKSVGSFTFKKLPENKIDLHGIISGDATPNIEFIVKIDQSAKKFSGTANFAYSSIHYEFLSEGDLNFPMGSMKVKFIRNHQENIINMNFAYKLLLPEASAELKLTVLNKTYIDGSLKTDLSMMKSQTELNMMAFNERFQLQASHDLTAELALGKVSVSYNEKDIVVQAEGQFELLKASLDLKVATPFDNFENVKITLKYDLLEDKKLAEFIITNQKTRTLEITGYLKMADENYYGNAELRIDSQWDDAFKFHLSSQGKSTDIKKSYDLEIKLNQHSFTSKAMVDFQEEYMKLTMRYDTEFLGIEKFETDIEIVDFLSWKNFSFKLKGLLNAYSVNTNIQFLSNGLKGLVELSFQPCNFQLLGKYDFVSNTKTAMVVIGIEANKYEVDSWMSSKEMYIQIKSPHESMQDIKVNGVYNLDQNDKSIHITISHNDAVSTLKGSISNMDTLTGNGDLSISTPFESFKTGNGGFQYDLSGLHKSGKIYGMKNGRKIGFEAIGNADADGAHINIKTETPFNDFRELALTGSYRSEERLKRAAIEFDRSPSQKYKASVSLEPTKATLHTKIPELGEDSFNMEANYDTDKVSVEAGNENKKSFISFSGRMKSNNGQIHLQMATPYFSGISCDIRGNFELQDNELSGKFSCSVNEHSIELEGKVNLALHGSLTAFIETSYQEFKTSELSGSWDLLSPLKSIQATITTPTKTHSIVMNGKIDKGTFTAEFSLPIAGLENVQINGEYNTEPGHLIYASIKQNMELWETKFESNCKNFNTTCGVSIAITTPKLFFGSFGGEASYSYNILSSDIEGKLKGYYNNQFIEALLKTKYGTTKGGIEGEMKTSIPGYESLLGSISYTFPGVSAKNSINIEYSVNHQIEKFMLEIFVDRNRFHLTGVTPFQGFKEIEASVNFSKETTGKTYLFKAFFKKEILEMNLNFKLTMEKTSGLLSLSLSLPFKLIGEGKFIVQYNFQNTLEIRSELETGAYAGKISIDASETKKSGQLAFYGMSPMLKNVPETKFSIHYDIETENKIFKFTSMNNGVLTEAECKFHIYFTKNKGQTSFNIQVPGNGWWKYLNGNLEYKMKDTAIILNINLANEKIKVSGIFDCKGSLEVKIPISGMEKFNAEWNWDANEKQFEFRINLPEHSVKIFIKGNSQTGTNLFAKFDLASTFLSGPISSQLQIDWKNFAEAKVDFDANWDKYSAKGSSNWNFQNKTGYLNINYQVPFSKILGKTSEYENGRMKLSYNIKMPELLLNFNALINEQEIFVISIDHKLGKLHLTLDSNALSFGNMKGTFGYNFIENKKSIEGMVQFNQKSLRVKGELETSTFFNTGAELNIQIFEKENYSMKLMYDIRKVSPKKIGMIQLHMADFAYFSMEGIFESQNKHGHGEIQMKSSNPILNRISLVGEYDFETSTSARIFIEWSEIEKCGFSFNLQNKSKNNFVATVGIETPFSELEQMKGTFLLNFEEVEKYFKIEIQRNDVAYGINLSYMNIDRILLIKLNGNLPIINIENLTGSIEVKKIEKSFEVYCTYNENNWKINGEVSSSTLEKFSANFYLTSSFPQLQSMLLNINYNFLLAESKNFFSFKGNFNRKIISVSGSIEKNDPMKVVLEIKTPIDILKFASVEGSMSLNTMEGFILLNYQDQFNHLKSAKVSYSHSSSSGVHSLKINTPFIGYEEFGADLKMKNNDFSAQLNFGNNREFDIQGEYSFENIMSLNGSMVATFGDLEKASFTSYFQNEPGHIIGSVEFKWNTNKVKADLSWFHPLNIEVNLETPWQPIDHFHAKFHFDINSEDQNDGNYWTLRTGAQLNQDKWTVSSGLKQFKEDLQNKIQGHIDFGETNHIKVDLVFGKRDEGYKLEALIITPFEGFDKFHLTTFGHMTSLEEKAFSMNSEFRLETPVTNLKNINAKILGRNNNGFFEAELVGTIDQTEMSAKLAFGRRNIGTYEMNAALHIPQYGVSKMKIYGTGEFSNEFLNGNIKIHLNIPPYMSNQQNNLEYQIQKNDGRVTLNLQSDIFGSNTLILEGDFKNQDLREFNGNLSLIIGNKKYDANLTWALTTSKISFNLIDNMLSTYLTMHQTTFEIEALMSSLKNANGSIKLDLDGKKHEATGHYSLDSNNFDVEGHLISAKLNEAKHFKLNINFKPWKKLDLNIATSNQVSYSVAVNMKNEYDQMKIFGSIRGSENQEYSVEFEMNKKQEIVFQLQTPKTSHSIQASVEMIDSNEGKLQVEAKSPFLSSGKITVSGALFLNKQRIEFSMFCDTGMSRNQIAGKLAFSKDNLEGHLQVKLPNYEVDDQILKLSLSLNDGINGDLRVHVFGNHEISIKIQGIEKGEVILSSTIYPSKSIHGIYKLQLTKKNEEIQGLNGSVNMNLGIEEFNIAVIANFPSIENMDASLSLQTPWKAMKSTEFDAKFKIYEGFLFDANFKSSSKIIPEAGISVKIHHSKTVLDASFHLNTPIKAFEHVGLLVNVPITPQENDRYEPRLSLTITNMSYNIHGSYRNVPEKIHMELEVTCPENTSRVDLYLKKISPYNFRAEITSPFKGYEKISFNGDLNLGFPKDGHIFGSLKINEKLYEATASLKIQPGMYKMILDVNTPYEKHNYGVTLRFEKTDRKTIHIELDYPGSTVGIEFDYVFESWDNLVTKVSLKTPYQGFEQIALYLVHQIGETGYTGEVKAQLGEKIIHVQISGHMKDEITEGNLKLQILGMHFQLQGFIKTTENHISTQATFSSSWKTLSSANLSYSHADNAREGLDSYSGEISYNGEVLFYFLKSKTEKQTELELKTPWRSMLGKYIIDLSSDKGNVEVQVTWNTRNPKENTLAITGTLEKTAFGKNGIIELTTPFRTIFLEGNYALSSLKFEHSVKYSWNLGKSMGYKILIKNDSDKNQINYSGDAELSVPKFPVGLSGFYRKVGDDVSLNIQSKYRNEVSKLSLEWRNHEKWNSEKKSFSIFLVQPLLQAPVSFQSSYSKTNGVTEIKAKIETSNDRNQDFEFKWIDDCSYTVNGLESSQLYPRRTEFLVSHPSTSLHIRLNTQFGEAKDESAMQVNFEYMDILKNMHSSDMAYHWYGKENRITTLFSLDQEKMNLDGSFIPTESGFISELKTQRGLMPKLTHSFTMDYKHPLMQLKLNHGENHGLTMKGGLPSDQEATIEISRQSFGKDLNDFLVLAKLNSSHIYHSQITWRPQFWQEAMHEVKNQFAQMRRQFGISIGDFKSFWIAEVEHRLQGIPANLQDYFVSLSNKISREFEEITQLYMEFKIQLQTMLETNSFFLKDIFSLVDYIGNLLQSLLNQMDEHLKKILFEIKNGAAEGIHMLKRGIIRSIQGIHEGMQSLSTMIFKFYKFIETFADDILLHWDEMAKNLEAFIQAKLNNIDDFIQQQIGIMLETYQKTLQNIQEVLTSQIQWLNQYGARLQDVIQAYQKLAMEHPTFGKALQLYQDYASWLEEIHFSEYTMQVKDHIAVLLESIMKNLEDWTKEYNEYGSFVKESIQGHYGNLKTYPLVGYFSQLVERFKLTLGWTWKYWELENMIQTNLRKILSLTKSQMNDILVELTTGHPSLWDFEHNYVWKPESGRIAITQQHPFIWKSFKEWPKVDDRYIKKFDQAFTKFDVNNQWHTFLNTVTASKEKLMEVASIIPPFHAYAIIAGNQHFITFDKRNFEFAGDCSYTLLHDPRDQFSIIANFVPGDNGIPVRNSLDIIQGTEKISISHDYKVTLNSNNIDLPWKSQEMIIQRESGAISFTNGKGIELQCLIKWDACTVKINGWYFGRTYGLLGIFNNEPFDDFTGPNGQIEKTINAFTDSWKTDKNCMMKNYATSVDPNNVPVETKSICDDMFSAHDSALSPCFQKVKTDTFVQMCYNDIEQMKNQPHSRSGACTSAAAYVSACRAEGMDIWMPPQCVKCELEDKSVIMAGESVTYKGNAPKGTDIIMAVDHQGCITSEQISGLVHNLDGELTASGSPDNRFTLIGFNGEAPRDQPHIQTSEGSIWVKSSSFKRAIEINGFGSIGMKVASIHDAVQFAARLPFRAGVGKAMLLVSCTPCDVKDTQIFSDSLNMLLERDISFNYITNDPIVLKGSKTNVTPWPIGYDSKMAYTLKDSRKLLGDAGLKDLIKIPKDLCVPLALETNGTAFSLEVFSGTDMKPTRAKKFYSVVAKKVIQTSQPSDCQRCDCVADHSGLGTTQCQPCLPHHLDKFVQDFNRLRYDID